MYNQVKRTLNMRHNKITNVLINDLLSGLEKIVNSITEIRNIESDSHGHGSRRVGINDYHARLVVNSALVFSEFLLSVFENKNKSDENN